MKSEGSWGGGGGGGTGREKSDIMPSSDNLHKIRDCHLGFLVLTCKNIWQLNEIKLNFGTRGGNNVWG